MVCCFEDLRDNGMDLRDVRRRFESHGSRSSMVPLRLGMPFVKASILSGDCHTLTSDLRTLVIDRCTRDG